MASYISVLSRMKCRHRNTYCDVSQNPECYVDVLIGDDILKPFEALLKIVEKTGHELDVWHSSLQVKGCKACEAIKQGRRPCAP